MAGVEITKMALGDMTPAPYNPRAIAPRALDGLKNSLARFGLVEPIVVNRRTGLIVGGHQRHRALREQHDGDLSVLVDVVLVDLDQTQERELNLALNNPAIQGDFSEALDALLAEVKEIDPAAYADLMLADLEIQTGDNGPPTPRGPGLQERFGVPPFTVLDARQGYWRQRKAGWLGLGIDSHAGRKINLRENRKPTMSAITAGTSPEVAERFKASGYSGSIFDPVLCEMAYRWWCPPEGVVFDPFAGGSVRGIVAAALGRHYCGIDLSVAQVQANQEQWRAVGPRLAGSGQVLSPPEPEAKVATGEPTPVEEHAGYLVKRDDLFDVGGSRGGKVRTCWRLAQGAKGLITAGARQSPQVNIVATVAQRLGIPCRVHVPSGALTPELEMAKAAGAELVQHRPGRNTVLIARARDDHEAHPGWTLIPFGMECHAAVEETAGQVAGLPACARLVVPVGSGMSLAGVVRGMQEAGRQTPILGVQVGADPTKRLDTWAPGWREQVQLVKSELEYHEAAPEVHLGQLRLDPIYEAKCLPFLQAGDMLWVVGIRATARPPERANTLAAHHPDPVWIQGNSLDMDELVGGWCDLVFTCPPYYDLERYTDAEDDLSNLDDYATFLRQYREIIARSLARLRDDRFACIVVGEIRGKDGRCRGFVPDTIRAFEDAGARLYNEAILVTPLGSVPIRAGRYFTSSRKLGKTHQNVLVFVKGDPEKATAACGQVEVQVPDEAEDGGA